MAEEQTVNDCGCCEGITTLTPQDQENPPGLSALAYRIGTHGSFKTTMLARLAGSQGIPALTTRADDDPAIALLDATAVLLDVLTFYQERIANEGYLRTATERMSVLELARAIGYELKPGVAASTYLAFEMETAKTAPTSAIIPTGTKVQSLPGQDEKPQTFETIEQIEARPEWNQLRPQTTRLIQPKSGDAKLYLQGTATNLKPGDAMLIVGDEPYFQHFQRVTKITPKTAPDPAASYTVVELDRALGSEMSQTPKVYALRLRANLFGFNAPDWRVMSNEVKAGFLGLADPKSPTIARYNEWPGLSLDHIVSGTGLLGEYYEYASTDPPDFTNLKLRRIDPIIDFDWQTGAPAPEISADYFSIRWTGFVKPKVTGEHTFTTRSDDGVRLRVDNKLIIEYWQPQSPTRHSGTIQLMAGKKYNLELEYYERAGGALIQLYWSAPGLVEEIIPATQLYPRDSQDIYIYLDTVYSQLLKDGWIVLSVPDDHKVYSIESVAEDSLTNFTLSAKTTRLKLKGENLPEKFDERLRETTVFAQNEELSVAAQPIDKPIDGDTIILDRLVSGLEEKRTLIVSGKPIPSESDDAIVSEVAVIKEVKASSNPIEIVLAEPLRKYDPATVVISANVARATHGETRREVLGSGDAARGFQKFTLKQKPLTYVSAPTAGGAETTLQVRVNEVLWQEKPSLYNLPARERAYITRLDDNGNVTLTFGDGVNGARLPTGDENIVATYRTGIGAAGMVKAGQLSLLMTRPLGVQKVTNPLAPTGAADPEKLDQARRNAPFTVLTLDRIVSLRDFEDFARAFAGIGKAQATWLWDGEQRIVHLTIAAAMSNGADYSVDPQSPLFKDLRSAMDAARDTVQPLVIASYEPIFFQLRARVVIDPAYIPEKVLAAVTAALQQTYTFERRDFGQPVYRSEVLAIIQAVAGVTAIFLDPLNLRGVLSVPTNLRGMAADPKIPLLPARRARREGAPAGQQGAIKPAQLLLLDPKGINVTKFKQ